MRLSCQCINNTPRLSFLGDRVYDVALPLYLLKKNPKSSVAQLGLARSRTASMTSFDKVAKDNLRLDHLLLVGPLVVIGFDIVL